jgi:hypothetical protein
VWNISQAFREELRNPNQQVAAKATVLDTDFKEIPDGDFFTAGADDFQDFIVDGNVDIDITRGTRRTAELSILNQNGQFTPTVSTTDYDGKFYVNRNIRLYRGVVIAGGAPVYAPIGTFMIDSVDVLVERNMSMLNLTLSDHWKKLTKNLVVATKTYADNTYLNTVIKDLVSDAGGDFPLAPALDPLGTRTDDAKRLNGKLVIERGTSRGDVLKDMAAKYGLDLYYNQEGRFTSNDRRAPADAQEVWSFYTSEGSPTFGMLNSVRKTISDDNLYNHVYVIGLGDPNHPVIYQKKNTDPASLVNTDRIGNRVRLVENQKWKTQASVDAAGQKLWDTRFNLFEEVVIDVVCNPALEADDVIRIYEPTFAKINGLYRINQMNVPLTTSKQTIRVSRNIYA